MATKIISIDMEAYERLTKARRDPGESFSRVIRRAEWPSESCSGRGLLEWLDGVRKGSAEVAEDLAENQALDKPPRDRWSA